MGMTRRVFVKSSAVVAAGAALGIPAVKNSGSVKIRTYFLSSDPIILPARFYACKETDTFGIHAQVADNNEVIVEMPLAAMKRAVEAGNASSYVILLVTDEDRPNTKMPVAMTVEADQVRFLFDNPGFPVWANLEDVKSVL